MMNIVENGIFQNISEQMGWPKLHKDHYPYEL